MMRMWRTREGKHTRDLARAASDEFGLGQVPARLQPDDVVRSICGFCSTGCSLDVHLQAGTAVNLTPSRSYPVNLGKACPKGWESLTPLAASDRAVKPLVRDRRGRLEAVTWSEALAEFASRGKAIMASHGPESFAFLSTGQIPTEEMALLGAVAKFGMGVRHGDGNTRQCMATSVVAHKECFGFDAPPYTYADFEASDVVVLIGSNLSIAHPILWERVCRNPHSPDLVVVDPRATETAMAATQHVAIRPKSDLTFLYGLARHLIHAGAIDETFVDAHTRGFDDFARHVDAFTPDRVCSETGLEREELDRVATTIARGERVSFWWTMGVNQSHEGVRTAQAVIALALLTGNIGRPGTGANSITGQCNAMGSRLFSNTTNLLGGHDFANAEHRAKVADVVGIDVARIPDRPSLAYDQIMEGVVAGRIKGLWVIATNTAHSWINQGLVGEILDRLDLLVVQDMYHSTETAQRADIVFPAAGWGEKEGTFINSERRFGRVRNVRTPPGDALSDFTIFKLVADAWGVGHLFEDWSSPEAVFRILRELSRGQPCDFTGIESYDALDAAGGVQWPFPEHAVATAEAAERRLFSDGRFFTPDGRARFVFAEPTPVSEPTSARYPLVLLTGRGSSAEWHTGTRTSKSPLLRSLSPTEPYVQLSPCDAEARGIHARDQVVVASRRGRLHARAFVTSTIEPGQVFIPMHFAETNQLTAPSFDPYSRQPSYKWAAVEVTRPERWEPET